MRLLIALFILSLPVIALAEEPPKPASNPPVTSTAPSIDPNKVISLTVGELNALLAAERSHAVASGVLDKINAQIQPKKDK